MAPDLQIAAHMQIHIIQTGRISIWFYSEKKSVFCLEGQCALNHLPHRFCIAIAETMHEEQQDTNMFTLLFSFTLLKLPIPFIITKLASEKSPDHYVPFHFVQLLEEYGPESRYSIFHMSVGM